MDKLKPLRNQKVLDRAREMLEKRRLCNSCLGRQFAQVSTGLSNRQRGEFIRESLSEKEPSKCELCKGLFGEIETLARRALEKAKGTEFRSFSVGTRTSPDSVRREEGFWEDFGIESTEPLKSELNREIGKAIERLSGRRAELDSPDITFTFSMETKNFSVHIKPLFLYGRYKKLVRGIPQTKWDRFRVTVEGIIAKPFMKATGASSHSMHAAGREDRDARCLDWRPFVLELQNPRKRKTDLKGIQQKLNRSRRIQVSGLRPSSRREVVEVKEMRPEKTYRMIVTFRKTLTNKNLATLRRFKGIVKQRTPSRVLRSRADLARKRAVKRIRVKKLSPKRAELVIKAQSGLYAKEFVTGDQGRTHPSVTSLLGNQASVKEFDVIKIHFRKNIKHP